MRTFFFSVLFNLRVGHLLKKFNVSRQKIPVLVFHRISPHYDPFTEPLHPNHFEEIIELLSKHYVFRSLDQLFHLTPKELSTSCFITFDDATEDFLEYAYPILKKRKVPVALFVPTHAADHNTNIWNYDFFSIFLTAQAKGKFIVTLNEEMFLINMGEEFPYHQIMRLHGAILKMHSSEREDFFEELKVTLNSFSESIRFAHTIAWNSLREMHSEKDIQILYGSHTHFHEYLPSLRGREAVEMELKLSKSQIEKEIGTKVLFLSYPNGGYNDSIIAAVRKNYKAAFTTDSVLLNAKEIFKDNNIYKLPRFLVYYKDARELFLRINGFEILWKIKKYFNLFIR